MVVMPHLLANGPFPERRVRAFHHDNTLHQSRPHFRHQVAEGPPAECVMMMAGPILSSNSAPRWRQAVCVNSMFDTYDPPCDATSCARSVARLPRPLPGH